MEIKTLPLSECELKFNDSEWRVEGYASVFDSVDKMGDTVIKGAFEQSLESERVVKMYYEHMRFLKPGRWDTLAEDSKGLSVIGHLTREHSLAKDLRAELRHGTIEGMSIGFSIPAGGYEEKKDGGRILKTIDLYEVSFTGNPAEPKATVDYFKSALEDLIEIKDVEAFLRDAANLSKTQAVQFIGRVKALCRSESELEASAMLLKMQAVNSLKIICDKYDLRKLL